MHWGPSARRCFGQKLQVGAALGLVLGGAQVPQRGAGSCFRRTGAPLGAEANHPRFFSFHRAKYVTSRESRCCHLFRRRQGLLGKGALDSRSLQCSPCAIELQFFSY